MELSLKERHYDPLRSGKVTKPQFIRAVGQMGVQISDADATKLADEFSTSKAGAPQVADWNLTSFRNT